MPKNEKPAPARTGQEQNSSGQAINNFRPDTGQAPRAIPPATGGLTVLRAVASGRRLTKTWKADPSGVPRIEPRELVRQFWAQVVPVNGIHDLARVLRDLERRPDQVIIRDTPAPGLDLGEPVERRAVNFEDLPIPWVMLDIDGLPAPDGLDPVANPEAAVRHVQGLLPATFQEASAYWQLSSSAGHPRKPGIRLHLFYYLAAPATSAAWKSWAKSFAFLDAGIFDRVKEHFIGAPIFEDGLPDPVTRRSGLLKGQTDVLAFTPPEVASTGPIRGQGAWPPPGAPEASTGYGADRLAEAVSAVELSVEGERNRSLFSAACDVGELVAGGEIEPAEAEAALVEAGVVAGLAEAEAAASVMSGLARGAGNPRGPRHDFADAPDDGDEPLTQNRRTAFRFLPLNELLAKPKPPDWLIRDILEAHSLALVFGESGAMKSFVAVDMALSISVGVGWHGRGVPNPGAVAYIAGEGHAGLSRRVQGWLKTHAPNAKPRFFLSDRGPQFLNKTSADAVKSAVADIAAANGPLRLIVVDTVARCFGPGDESKTEDMSAFVAEMDVLRTKFHCAVLLVHHSGLAEKDRARGAYALKAALDWEYRLDICGDRRKLTCTKSKDFEPPKPMSFAPVTVGTGWLDPETGEEMTTIVLASCAVPPETTAGMKLSPQQRVVLDVLRTLAASGDGPPAGPGGPPDVRGVPEAAWRAEVYARLEGAPDAKRAAFTRARKALLEGNHAGGAEGIFWPTG